MHAESVFRANRFLTSTQNAGSGWGYGKENKQTFIEPTCWAMLSLSAQVDPEPGVDCEASEIYRRGLACLLAAQQDDGGWANAIDAATPGDIRTALAVWTLAAGKEASGESAQPIDRGLDWLMQNRLREGGWAWCYGAYNFVEPTALAVLALQQTQRLDLLREELVQFILHLQCDDGGWNSHTRIMLDVPQPGQLSVTPVALVALSKLGVNSQHEAVIRALAYLDVQLKSGELHTNYARALWLWALSGHGFVLGDEPVSAILPALLACQAPEGHWDGNVLLTALASFALQGVRS